LTWPLSPEDAECRVDFEKNELTEASVTALREQKNLVNPSDSAYNNTLGLGVTQLADECTEIRPIAPEYGQDGTCAARPISSITYTKTVQLRNS
jgi:hypothetical protein